jgi:hypothetical protein
MRNVLASIPAAAQPLALVVAVLALHGVWTIGAAGPSTHLERAPTMAEADAAYRRAARDSVKDMLQSAVEASAEFKKPLVVTLPKRVPDRFEIMDNYPAIAAMSEWTTRKSDTSRGEYDLLIELTPAGRAEHFPHVEETETAYRIGVAKREIRSFRVDPVAKKAGEQLVWFQYAWTPITPAGRRLHARTAFRGADSDVFSGRATFRRTPAAWVLVEIDVEDDVYFMTRDGLVAAQ